MDHPFLRAMVSSKAAGARVAKGTPVAIKRDTAKAKAKVSSKRRSKKVVGSTVEGTEEDEAVEEDTGSGITGIEEMAETSPPEITEDTEEHPIPGVTYPVDLDSVYSILL